MLEQIFGYIIGAMAIIGFAICVFTVIACGILNLISKFNVWSVRRQVHTNPNAFFFTPAPVQPQFNNQIIPVTPVQQVVGTEPPGEVRLRYNLARD